MIITAKKDIVCVYRYPTFYVVFLQQSYKQQVAREKQLWMLMFITV